MSDIYDQASDREQLDRDLAIRQAMKAPPAAKSTGHCLYCNNQLDSRARWCDAGCREDWELEQESRRRHRGRA